MMSRLHRCQEQILHRRRLATLLLLVVFGLFQVSSVAHDFQHAIADFADQCATCVHTDKFDSCPVHSPPAADEILFTGTLIADAAECETSAPRHSRHARAPPRN